MNPRQRRGAILVGLAVVGSLGVFFAVLVYLAEVSSRVGDVVDVVVLARDVPAYQPLEAADLTTREVPARWSGELSVTDPSTVLGLVPTTDQPSGALVQSGTFVPRPGVQRGFREVAILVDAETGVAGRVSAGDRVDILATSDLGDGPDGRQARVWVSNALIIDVGIAQDVEDVTPDGGFTEGRAVPVTFALPVAEALEVSYAESFATKLRLALRGGGDVEDVPVDQRTYAPELS